MVGLQGLGHLISFSDAYSLDYKYPESLAHRQVSSLFFRTCISLQYFYECLVTAPIIANETIIKMENLPSEAASNPQTIQFAIAEAGPSSVGDARGEDPQPEQPAASQAGSPATTVDYIDLLGETALHHAAKRGELESVRKLTHTHANVGIHDNDGLLAAQIACIGSHWDIMEYLFDIDEDNTLINDVIAGGEFSGSTCLHVAVKRNAWKAVRYLAANMEVDTLYRLDNDGLTAWDLACGRSKLSRGRDHKKQSLPFGGAPLSSIAHNSASSIGVHSTGSAQSTGQHVSYHPSFPVNLEVSCILLARDSQINRAEFQYPLWEEREISGINCWLLPKNHVGMHRYEPRLHMLTNSS